MDDIVYIPAFWIFLFFHLQQLMKTSLHQKLTVTKKGAGDPQSMF